MHLFHNIYQSDSLHLIEFVLNHSSTKSCFEWKMLPFTLHYLCDFWKSHNRTDFTQGSKENREEWKCFVIISKWGCANNSHLPGWPHKLLLRAASSGRSSTTGVCSKAAIQDAKQLYGLLLPGRGNEINLWLLPT